MRTETGVVSRGWLGVILLAGCAAGESETIGAANLSSALSVGDGSTTGPVDATSEAGDTTTAQPTTGTGGPDPTANPTAPETDSGAGGASSGSTGSPGGPCMLAVDCDDANACTEDNCINSVCAHNPVDCDDGFDCTTDACDPLSGACTNAPDDAACDDADACTGVESCSAATGCVAGTPVTCTDGASCTMDVCDPGTGTCSFNPIDACNSGDGCCPFGCSVADTDCSCSNLALAATASSSGGGSNATGYGPASWNDGNGESSCDVNCSNQCFGWIDNGPSPQGAWMQLQWGSSQDIGSMVIDGIAAGGCQSTQRGLAGGDIQYWNGATWVDAQSFSGGTGDLEFTFDPPLQTSRLRIYDAVAPAGNGFNSLAFEWYVYEPLGCTP